MVCNGSSRAARSCGIMGGGFNTVANARSVAATATVTVASVRAHWLRLDAGVNCRAALLQQKPQWLQQRVHVVLVTGHCRRWCSRNGQRWR